MDKYEYDSMTQEESDDQTTNAYLDLKARHGIENLKTQYSELKRLIDEVYDTASSYTGFDLRHELETELPRMD